MYQVLQQSFFAVQGRTGVHKPCARTIRSFSGVLCNCSSRGSHGFVIMILNNRENIQLENIASDIILLSWHFSEILLSIRVSMPMHFLTANTQTSHDSSTWVRARAPKRLQNRLVHGARARTHYALGKFHAFLQEDTVNSTLGKRHSACKKWCICNSSAPKAHERHHDHLCVRNFLEAKFFLCDHHKMYINKRRRVHFAIVLLTLMPESNQSFSPYIARRVGEAMNPGPPKSPEGCYTKIVFVNPTAVNKKVSTLLEMKADIYCLAETSATLLVQQAVTTEFRSVDFTSLWSPPVPPHAATTREDAAFRGSATGVSLHSTWPIRSSRIEISPDIDPLRLVSGIIELGPVHVHLITIYGYPKPHRDAFVKTDQLLAAAARLADAVGLPAIIVGDFNHPPEKLYT